MNDQQKNRIFAQSRANQQAKRHLGQTITTQIFGRMVQGKIIAVHPFGTIDIETASGNYRVSGLSLN